MDATRSNQLTFLPCAYLYARPHARPRDASVGQVVKYGSYGSYMQLFPTNNMIYPFNVGVNFSNVIVEEYLIAHYFDIFANIIIIERLKYHIIYL